MTRHIEETLQAACVRWMGYQHPAEAALLHHSPNGGRRDAREGARFKAMGVRAGFPDLFLFVPRGSWHGLAIELKTAEGRQSAAQKIWQARLTEQGYLYAVVRSFEEFRAAVDHYLAFDDNGPNGLYKGNDDER